MTHIQIESMQIINLDLKVTMFGIERIERSSKIEESNSTKVEGKNTDPIKSEEVINRWIRSSLNHTDSKSPFPCLRPRVM